MSRTEDRLAFRVLSRGALSWGHSPNEAIYSDCLAGHIVCILICLSKREGQTV